MMLMMLIVGSDCLRRVMDAYVVDRFGEKMVFCLRGKSLRDILSLPDNKKMEFGVDGFTFRDCDLYFIKYMGISFENGRPVYDMSGLGFESSTTEIVSSPVGSATISCSD